MNELEQNNQNDTAKIAYDTLLPAVKGGRCWNGFHKDKGQIVHSVPAMPKGTNGDWFYKALCGVEPGIRSYGWTNTGKDVNCPKCLKKLSAINGR